MTLLAAFALLAVTAGAADARPRCSPDPTVAARFVVPPPPFVARVVAVAQRPIPPGESKGRGRAYKRLYAVTFVAVQGNAVLPGGHRYTQFAYVARKSPTGAWCYLKGGSGP